MKKWRKLAAAALSASLVLSLAGCGSTGSAGEEPDAAAEETELTAEDVAAAMEKAVGNGKTGSAAKEETVYVFTDASGAKKSVTVSNWLKNPEGDSVLTDKSGLKDITNVKGDETFTADGEELTWNADGSDIYYEGTTDREIPVTTKITYYLDGAEIAPAELAGKSGRVTIHIDYENHEKRGDVYVPFTAVTGIAFSNSNAKNVTVDNGSVLSEGKNTVVVGMAFPGLQESVSAVQKDTEAKLEELDADSGLTDKITDLDIPDSVEITLDAEAFKMTACLTMVSAELLAQEDEEADADADDALTVKLVFFTYLVKPLSSRTAIR